MSTRSLKNNSLQHLAGNTLLAGSTYFDQIDGLTLDTELAQVNSGEYLKEITKSHWKTFDSKTTCFNSVCRKQFTALLERHHHCRRCGEIFCNACLKFSRRLNKLAKPDPAGDWYKVCKACFEQGQLTDGQTRSHTIDFSKLRTEGQKIAAAIGTTLESPFWRSRLDLGRECQRLLRGFEQSVGCSEIKLTLHGVKSLVTTPEWMKSSVWIREDLATKCQICSGTFSITKQKNFCRVCGIAVCKSCSTEDLLVYIPDEEKGKKENCRAKLAIIKIVGSPEIEPEISWYLRVCPVCKNILETHQVEAYEEEFSPSVKDGFMDHLHKLNEAFQEAENRIRTHLPKYREIIELLDNATKTNNNNSHIKVLAKAQEDLADDLAQYVTVIQQLKRLRPMTETQISLLKTFIRAKCEFYLDQMSTFRTLKHKLSESASTESLDFIQRIIDRNAIIGTHLYLRQLVYESIHLCHKYKIEEYLPCFLTQIEQSVEKDAQCCLLREGEDIDQHMELVKAMIKENLKNKKFINLSQSLIDTNGSRYVSKTMRLRVETVLHKVNNQLCLVSANRSFQASKTALKKALEELKQHKSKDAEEMKDFCFVDKPV